MQTLELINERFARQMRSVLLNFMRRSADITVGSIKIQKYADFERNLPVPSNLNMVQMKPDVYKRQIPCRWGVDYANNARSVTRQPRRHSG